MIKNYFKIAWRSLMKNKLFSFINIAGLSVGLSCCMLSTLVILLSKDFLQLVLVAIFIAFPIAWLVARRWLEGFTIRVGIGWAVFAWTGGVVAVIAFATISFQVVRAAFANPVKSLKEM